MCIHYCHYSIQNINQYQLILHVNFTPLTKKRKPFTPLLYMRHSFDYFFIIYEIIQQLFVFLYKTLNWVLIV